MSKEDTRKRIIEKAFELFGEKGYIASSTREIAKRAGVNEVTLFRHFGSKENLMNEGVELLFLSEVTDFDWSKYLKGSLAEDLTTMARFFLEVTFRKLNLIKVALIEMHRSPEIGNMTRNIGLQLRKSLFQYFKKMHEMGRVSLADFEMLAIIFFDILFMYTISNYIFSAEERDFREDKEVFIQNVVSLFSARLLNK